MISLAKPQTVRQGITSPIGFVKAAVGETDANYERQFSDLAFGKFRDKAPGLQKYLIGFEMIDKDDEGNKAVGVFASRVGKEMLLAPQFFIRGQLKGTDLMYIVGQDAFVPLTESWINYLLNRKPQIVGRPEKTPRRDLGLRSPDFRLFVNPPLLASKWASDNDVTLQDIVTRWERSPVRQEMVPFLKSAFCGDPFRGPAFQKPTLSLPGFLKTATQGQRDVFFRTFDAHEKYADAILRFYPRETVESWRAIRTEKKASEVLKVKFDQDHLGGRDTPPEIPVVLVRGQDIARGDLTPEQKKRFIEEGYCVLTDMPEKSKNRLFTANVPEAAGGPVESGRYRVLTPSGEKREMYCLVDPLWVGCGCDKDVRVVTVVDPDTRQYGNYETLRVAASEKLECPQDFVNLKDAESLENKDLAFLVAPTGYVCTNVFAVTDRKGLPDGSVELTVTSRDTVFRSRAESRPTPHHPGLYRDSIRKIILSDREGSRYTQLGESLFLPKGWKACVLGKAGEGDDSWSWKNLEPTEMLCGSLNELIGDAVKAAMLQGNVTTLEVTGEHALSRTWAIRVGNGLQRGLTKGAAVRTLLVECGLDHTDALDLLDETRRDVGVPLRRFLVKRAWGEPPRSAEFRDPDIAFDDRGTQVQYPMIQGERIGENDGASAEESLKYDPYVDDSMRYRAEQAAGTGQKEILDTAAIAGLVKATDPTERSGTMVSDLLIGLDRLGRILFLYYWHYDKFQEMYGSQDAADMEDKLRNCFKGLGELVIDLKQKLSDPSSDDAVGGGEDDLYRE